MRKSILNLCDVLARWLFYFLYGQKQSDHTWRLWMSGLFMGTCLTLPKSSSSRGMNQSFFCKMILPSLTYFLLRNKDVPVNHRDFWYATYTLYSVSEMVDNEEKLNDTASGSSGGDQGSSNRQLTMVSFLKPVLKQIIMAGKSMQLLKNLDRKEPEQSQRSSRGWCSGSDA